MSVMLELQIQCPVGTVCQGYPWQDFARLGYHTEHFDSWECLRLRQEWWASQGVESRLGRLSQQLRDATLPDVVVP